MAEVADARYSEVRRRDCYVRWSLSIVCAKGRLVGFRQSEVMTSPKLARFRPAARGVSSNRGSALSTQHGNVGDQIKCREIG